MKLQLERTLKELQKMDKISKMLHSLLESSGSVVQNQIHNMMERYNEINKMRDVYHEVIFLKNKYSIKQN